MAGYPCQMEEIQSICNNHNIILIEDYAHAIGTKYNENHVGKFGFSGTFPFIQLNRSLRERWYCYI